MIPKHLIPRRKRKTVSRKSVLYQELALSPAAGVASTGDQSSVVAPSAAPLAGVAGKQYIREAGVEVGEEDEISDSEAETESGGEDTGSGDLKSTGQILWIRGLSRLQTQACYPSGCSFVLVLNYKKLLSLLFC